MDEWILFQISINSNIEILKWEILGIKNSQFYFCYVYQISLLISSLERKHELSFISVSVLLLM